jgi:hypothetical protein
MEYGLDVTQKKKPRSYSLMVAEALERGEDPAAVEQSVMAEAEAEEQESPFQRDEQELPFNLGLDPSAYKPPPPVPVKPVQPRSMLEKRQAEEALLEDQIRAKEDEMGQSRAGLERGLLGAIQTIGGSSIRRSGCR